MNSRIVPFVLIGGLAALAGCEDPRIVSVAPPGFENPRVPPPTSGSGSEALGESRSTNAPPTRALSTIISEPTPIGERKKSASGLAYETLKEGAGESAKPGQTVKVHYLGTLIDGTKFDSSYDKGSPIDFPIGMGRVIKGWDEGVPGMKIGEKRRLYIPSDMAYGANGSPPAIPANANLIFEVELLGVQ